MPKLLPGIYTRVIKITFSITFSCSGWREKLFKRLSELPNLRQLRVIQTSHVGCCESLIKIY